MKKRKRPPMFDPEAFSVYRTSPSQAVCPLGERLSDAQQRMIDALLLMGVTATLVRRWRPLPHARHDPAGAG